MDLIRRYRKYADYAAWGVALLATAGSLALSDVFGYQPCKLCWYQRIAMYPLVVIIGFGIVKRHQEYRAPALALAVIGWVIATYHSLLQWGIVPERLAPCVQGISCATKQIDWLGFVTIPFMSFVSFSVIIALLLWGGKETKDES